MQNIFLKVSVIILAFGLASCSSMPDLFGTSGSKKTTHAKVSEQKAVLASTVDNAGQEKNVNLTMAGGGEIGLKSMDANDKSKMSRALDAAPGKATQWGNGATGVNYTVTPIKKVVIDNNPFCREYLVMVVRGAKQKEINGTACVTTDGSWHTI